MGKKWVQDMEKRQWTEVVFFSEEHVKCQQNAWKNNMMRTEGLCCWVHGLFSSFCETEGGTL